MDWYDIDWYVDDDWMRCEEGKGRECDIEGSSMLSTASIQHTKSLQMIEQESYSKDHCRSSECNNG